jgi:predicted ArsR family transcriptional regulator
MRHDGDMTDDRTLRLTVSEAAGALGISAEAVRQRIKRGTIDAEKDAGGTVYVLVDADRTCTNADSTTDMTSDKADLVESLREQVAYLREQLDQERQTRTEERRRHDTLLAQLMQRIPELEAPESAGDAPDAAAPRPTTEEQQEQTSRPWWRRMFGS